MDGQTKKETSAEIILIDKPAGITSFDVIRKLRKKIGEKKMGHAGTLDPFATGLLVVGVGGGTKKLREFIGLSKIYDAEIVLGKRTDTGDITGKVIEEKEVPPISDAQIEEVLDEMVGPLTLPVPAYSAVKRQGKPLYEYAREGKSMPLPLSEMAVIDAELLGHKGNIVRARFNVESGTYIRSLAEEFGRRLNTVAMLKNLRRISVGSFSIDDAESL